MLCLGAVVVLVVVDVVGVGVGVGVEVVDFAFPFPLGGIIVCEFGCWCCCGVLCYLVLGC